MPMVMTAMPTGRNEKNDRPGKPCFCSSSLTTRLGGVPMSVSMPPRLPAKAKGMSSRELLNPPCAAMLTMIGIISATVPVLLTNAPIADVASMTSKNALVSLPFAIPIIRLPAARARPVWSMAPPTTKSPVIMMTTDEEKPENASAGVSMPERMSTTSAVKATMSLLKRPQMNRAMVMASTMRVIVMLQTYDFSSTYSIILCLFSEIQQLLCLLLTQLRQDRDATESGSCDTTESGS